VQVVSFVFFSVINLNEGMFSKSLKQMPRTLGRRLQDMCEQGQVEPMQNSRCVYRSPKRFLFWIGTCFYGKLSNHGGLGASIAFGFLEALK
jgi:hypothetical protein